MKHEINTDAAAAAAAAGAAASVLISCFIFIFYFGFSFDLILIFGFFFQTPIAQQSWTFLDAFTCHPLLSLFVLACSFLAVVSLPN